MCDTCSSSRYKRFVCIYNMKAENVSKSLWKQRFKSSVIISFSKAQRM